MIKKEKAYYVAYLFFLNLGIVSLLLFILNSVISLNISLLLSLNWFFSIAVFSLLISFVCKYNLNLINNKPSQFIDSIFETAPYFFFTILVVMVVNQFFKLDFITARNLHLSVFAIAFGFLAFYKNRGRVERELEEEKKEEEREEQKRKQEFEWKFPRISKIWGLRQIVRWMYKEGWWYSVGLILIVISGLILASHNLTILDPYTDEYSHLVSAKDLVEGRGLTYERAPLVTLLSSFFYVIGKASSFYEYVYWARVPGVIFGILTVIPIYLLARKVSKTSGLLASFLWITNPWVLGVIRNVREYAYYPFIALIFLLLLIKSEDYLKDKNVKKYYLQLILVFAILIYAIFVDTSSTLKIIGILFLGNLVYLGTFKFKEIKKFFISNKNLFIFLSFLLVTILSFIVYQGYNHPDLVLNNISFEGRWVKFFFDTSVGFPMQWWNGLGVYSYYLWGFFLLGTVSSLFLKKYENIRILIIFTMIILFFTLFFGRYFRPRYIFYAMPFFVILLSNGIYLLSKQFRYISNKKLAISLFLILLVLLFQFFSISNTLYPIISETHGYVGPTNEHHDKVQQTMNFFKNQDISKEDVFIATVFENVLILSFDIDKDRIYHFDYKDENRFDYVEKIISENDQGWIILDWRRNGYWVEGYPKEGSFFIGDTRIQVVQNEEGFQIYQWN